MALLDKADTSSGIWEGLNLDGLVADTDNIQKPWVMILSRGYSRDTFLSYPLPGVPHYFRVSEGAIMLMLFDVASASRILADAFKVDECMANGLKELYGNPALLKECSYVVLHANECVFVPVHTMVCAVALTDLSKGFVFPYVSEAAVKAKGPAPKDFFPILKKVAQSQGAKPWDNMIACFDALEKIASEASEPAAAEAPAADVDLADEPAQEPDEADAHS